MKKEDLFQDRKKNVASIVAAAYFIAHSLSIAPAYAATDFSDFGSSEVVARGFHAGGRIFKSSSKSVTRSLFNKKATIEQPTKMTKATIERPKNLNAEPVFASTSIYAAPASISQRGNNYLGLQLGLSASHTIGNGMREFKQGGEIQQPRTELEVINQKNIDLDQRLGQVEMK